MAIANEGQILYGKAGFPLFGKNGTILYKDEISIACEIVISWEDGPDVDICGFWNFDRDQCVGWSWGHTDTEKDGFTAHWEGDNTGGGPEYVNLGYSGATLLKNKWYEIHTNWYRTETDPETGKPKEDGGDCTVSVSDGRGHSFQHTFHPGNNHGHRAEQNDPGVKIIFENNGKLKGIEAV